MESNAINVTAELELEFDRTHVLAEHDSVARKVCMTSLSLATTATIVFCTARVAMEMWRRRVFPTCGFHFRSLLLFSLLSALQLFESSVLLFCFLFVEGHVGSAANRLIGGSQMLVGLMRLVHCVKEVFVLGIGFLELLRLFSVAHTGHKLLNSFVDRQGLQTGCLVAATLLTLAVQYIEDTTLTLLTFNLAITLCLSLAVFILLFLYGRRLSFHFTQDEILPVKVALLLLVVSLVQDGAEIAQAAMYKFGIFHWDHFDLLSLTKWTLACLYPLSYLLIYNLPSCSHKLFSSLNNDAESSTVPSVGLVSLDRAEASAVGGDTTELNSLVFTMDSSDGEGAAGAADGSRVNRGLQA